MRSTRSCSGQHVVEGVVHRGLLFRVERVHLGLRPSSAKHTGKDDGPISLRQLLQEIDGTTRGLPNSRIRDGGEG
jgi:hypothetical protein